MDPVGSAAPRCRGPFAGGGVGKVDWCLIREVELKMRHRQLGRDGIGGGRKG